MLIHWELNFWRLPPRVPARLMNPSLLWLKKLSKEFPRLMMLPAIVISQLVNKEEELRSVIQLRKRKNLLDVAEEIKQIKNILNSKKKK